MDNWSLPKSLIDKLLDLPSDVKIEDFDAHLENLKESVKEHPSPNAYSRKVLFQDERGEILIMRWAEDQFCYPHDHAMAVGYVVLLEGDFVERDYEFDGALIPKGVHHASSPVIFPFEKTRIHDMKCIQGGYSLHVYMPSITGMKVYDPEQQRTLHVDDSCGAWVPAESAKILKSEDWVSIPTNP